MPAPLHKSKGFQTGLGSRWASFTANGPSYWGKADDISLLTGSHQLATHHSHANQERTAWGLFFHPTSYYPRQFGSCSKAFIDWSANYSSQYIILHSCRHGTAEFRYQKQIDNMQNTCYIWSVNALVMLPEVTAGEIWWNIYSTQSA